MKPRPWLVVVLVGALAGLVFAGVSTYDFVQHLDRQVHSLHCSFIPGASHAGESGCQVAMMSSYSSVLRTRVWGGIPISLPAMAVFAFLALFALDLMIARRQRDARATAFLALASALPALASLVMLAISITQLGTACKLCVGIYIASALCLTGSIVLWRQAVRARGTVAPVARRRKARSAFEHGDEPAWAGGASSATAAAPVETIAADDETSMGFLAGAFAVGVAFVLLPVIVYLALAPDHAKFVGTCDGLAKPDDTYRVMVDVERTNGGVPALEVLDPLCPACKAFEDRLGRSGVGAHLDRRAILFPLDNTCNWMVTEATHPGACAISEAVLCAGARAPAVIAWAFEEQERVREETRKDAGAAARIVKQRFPELAACVGSPEARSRLNKSLRWAVANNIRVLTPQLFVDGVKLCDEDVDLGLEYTLRVMLERHAAKTLANPAARPAEVHEAVGSAGSGPPAAVAPEPSGHAAKEPATPKAEPVDLGDRLDATGESGKASETPAGAPSGKVSETPAGKAAGAPSGKADRSGAGAKSRAPADDKPVTSPGAVTSPSAVDKPPAATDKPVTSPSSDTPVTSPSGGDKPAAPPSETKPPGDDKPAEPQSRRTSPSPPWASEDEPARAEDGPAGRAREARWLRRSPHGEAVATRGAP